MTDATPTPDPVAPQPVVPPVATPPQYATPGPTAVVPGRTLGIVALVLSFLGGLAIVGIILGFVARAQSKAAGVKNTPATAAIIVGFIVIALFIIGIILVAVTLTAACNGIEPGTYQLENGGTLTCG